MSWPGAGRRAARLVSGDRAGGGDAAMAAAIAAGLLLAAWRGVPRAAAQQPEVPVIEHQALRCLVQDRFALVEAVIRPAAQVTRARVYFTSSAGDEYYSVDMQPAEGGRFQARLPKPRRKAGPVIYFIEVLSPGGALQRTPEVKVDVVKNPTACAEPERVAAQAPGGDVDLHASTPRPRRPKGFGGVGRIVVPAESVPPATAEDVVAEPSPTSAPAAESAPAGRTARPAEPPARPEYAIGPDDIVKVVVVGHDDLAQTLLVQQDGTFIFPLIGRVKAADLTPGQLEKHVAARLAKGYIRDPQVSVTVQEYRSKTVMVMGEVSRPGPYPLSASLRIVEVLAKAGMTAGAGTEVQVLRPLGVTDRPLLPNEVDGGDGAGAGAGPQAEILKVDLRAIQQGDLEANLVLRPNDTVYVPPAAKFYVTGEARSPGAYTLTPGITVREAVILAGGFTENASTGRTRVIREVEGQKREVKVKLDDPVRPGDIIVVKGKLF